jgi:hypothetical protein
MTWMTYVGPKITQMTSKKRGLTLKSFKADIFILIFFFNQISGCLFEITITS